MFYVPPSSSPATNSLSGRFALIIDGLCHAVAARAPGNIVAAPLLVLLWSRLRRLAARFARLVERAAAGTLPLPRPRAARSGSAKPGQRWPSGYAWLVRLVPEAAAYGSQLRHLLSEPEMAALIAAVPHAGRLFGPLRQMLAVPVKAPQPRVAKIRACVQPTPQPDPDLDIVPESGFLPSGVPYWARNAWPGHDFAGRDLPGQGPPKRQGPPNSQGRPTAAPLRRAPPPKRQGPPNSQGLPNSQAPPIGGATAWRR